MSENPPLSSGGLNLQACLEKSITLVVRDLGPFVECNIGFADEKSRAVRGRLVGIEPEVGVWFEPERVANQENPPGEGWRVLVLWRDILMLMRSEARDLPAPARLPEKPIGLRSRLEPSPSQAG